MKKITQFLAVFALFTSFANAQCDRDGGFVAVADPVAYPIDGTATQTFTVSGDKQVLFGDDFATVQGIELRVFLSTASTVGAGEEIEISTEPLQDDDGGMDMGSPITGPKMFDLPAGVELSQYNYVLVQCVVANMLWGRAELSEPSGPDCAVLSTAETTFSNFSMAPNPAKNQVSITGIAGEIEQISIFDTTGKKVLTQNSLMNGALDISTLNTGIYMMNIKANGQETTKKLLVK